MGVITATSYLILNNGNPQEEPSRESNAPRSAVRSSTRSPKLPLPGRESAGPQVVDNEDESSVTQPYGTAIPGDFQAEKLQSDQVLETPPVTTAQSTNHLNIEEPLPEQPADPGKAIQLAENFRLPVSILLQGVSRNNQNAMASPAVSTATQELADSFYRALAATASETDQTLDNVTANDPENEDTRIIPPTLETEKLRVQADELYRTLFGDAAYGQHTVSSLIEVRLPPLPETEPGK